MFLLLVLLCTHIIFNTAIEIRESSFEQQKAFPQISHGKFLAQFSSLPTQYFANICIDTIAHNSTFINKSDSL
jgi:hypothetical protein